MRSIHSMAWLAQRSMHAWPALSQPWLDFRTRRAMSFGGFTRSLHPPTAAVQAAVAEAAGVAPVLLGQVQAALLAALQNDTASISGERVRMASSYATKGLGLPPTGGWLRCTLAQCPSPGGAFLQWMGCVRVALALGSWPVRGGLACGRLPASPSHASCPRTRLEV